jgi:hypothetical protein
MKPYFMNESVSTGSNKSVAQIIRESSPLEKLNYISIYPFAIQYVDEPSEELQIVAILGNHRVFKYIKNPTEKVKSLALELILAS